MTTLFVILENYDIEDHYHVQVSREFTIPAKRLKLQSPLRTKPIFAAIIWNWYSGKPIIVY